MTGRVGRLFLAALRLDRWTPERVEEEARRALEHGVGGFLVFGGDLDEVADLARKARAAADRPLWFAADLERGAGQQFRGASVLPPPAGLARHPEPATAVRRAARLTAREARSAGINWVLAPVLDLDVEPDNPIVGTRSFGADPARVARLGRLWTETCQQEGVAACAKHFPGHGRTTTDSHAGLPVVRASGQELEDDLLPFRRAAHVAAAVMTAHVRYPSLDDDAPATLSRTVLRRLREGMDFRGLVVTDALGMEGLRAAGAGGATEGWLAVRALRAGCDVLLYPEDLARTVRTVKQAAEQDPRLRRAVVEARDRSRRLLDRFGDRPRRELPASDAAEEAAELAEACVTARGRPPGSLLAGADGVRLAALSDDTSPPAADPELPHARAFADGLRERGWRVRPRAEGADEDLPTVVLLEATPRAGKGRAGLSSATRERLRSLLTAHGAEGETGRTEEPPAYLIVLGHERLLRETGADGACAWSSEPDLARAAARWLDARVRREG